MEQTETPAKRSIFSAVSLLLALLPVAFVVRVMTGGRAEGFGAWTQAGYLLFSLPVLSLLGIACLFVARSRRERAVLIVPAFIFHLLYLWLFVNALSS